MYALLVRLFGLALDVFYRRRHLGDEVPAEGPVLVVANHPNALLDPIAVTRVAERPVRLLAKAPLFSMPVLEWLVRAMRCLPVFRAKDGADAKQNAETFRAVYDALDAGEAICLFSEGIRHHLPSLQPLKTGAARMALGAMAERAALASVQIVPVGVVYTDKLRFRSELVTEVGTPIEAARFIDAYRRDERAAVRALTDEIAASIRAATLNLERWEDQPLLGLAKALLEETGEDRIARLRAMADGAARLREVDPARQEALRARVERFSGRLSEVDIDARHTGARYSVGAVARFCLGNVGALTLGLPLASLGALAYRPPYLVARYVPPLFRPAPDLLATVRILVGIVLFPPWHATLVGLTATLLTWHRAIAVALALPFVGLYAHRFVRHRAAALRDAWSFLVLLTSGRLRRELFLERDAILRELEEAAKLLDEGKRARRA